MNETAAQKILLKTEAEASLCAPSDLRRYLTGFSSTFGYLLTDGDGTVFYTDPRYLEAARKQLGAKGIRVEKFESLEKILKGYKKIAVPIGKISADEYLKLKSYGLEITDSLPAFTEEMAVKRTDELENIARACKIADEAYLGLLGRFREGMTENELAAELEYLMRTGGASGTSFETIVAFGKNSSVPHHETGETKLKYGDVVLIDFGCVAGGYCSDCTRTLVFGGKPDAEFAEMYDRVLNAHMLAKEKIRENMSGREADATARDYLTGYSLGEYFTHSLGHGIGINIHEYPNLSPKSEHILKQNMVFSDEPGVYFEGKYGIRIEDTVTLTADGVKSLTDTDKKLTVL